MVPIMAMVALAVPAAALTESEQKFLDAAVRGDMDDLTRYHLSGASIDCQDHQGNTALMHAANYGHTKLVRYLIEKKAGLDFTTTNTGTSALMYAAEKGSRDIAVALIKAEADGSLTNSSGSNAAEVAQAAGYSRLAKYLERYTKRRPSKDGDKKELLPDYENLSPNDALWKAVRVSNVQQVQRAIVRKADVNARDGDGSSILMIACQRGDAPVVRCLLEAGADARTTNNWGNSPLTWACQQENEEVVELLLAKKVNVNAHAPDGNTALHYASDKGYDKIVLLLCKKGANVKTRNKNGKTAFDIASDRGYRKVMSVLRRHGATR